MARFVLSFIFECFGYALFYFDYILFLLPAFSWPQNLWKCKCREREREQECKREQVQ